MPLVEKEIHGSRMLLDTEDLGLSTQLLQDGTRENEAPFLVAGIVTKNMTVIEAGANLGFYALIEGKQGAMVFAVEPVPENAEILRKNVDLNDYDIEVFGIALGNKNAESPFFKSGVSNWGRMGEKTLPFAGEEITVQEVTLDTFVDVFVAEPVDFLRFDIEGYEIELIEGAQKTLLSMPGGSWIFGEFHPRLFENPMDLHPTVENILNHGFEQRFTIPFPEARFETMCEKYPGSAPLFFLQKC